MVNIENPQLVLCVICNGGLHPDARGSAARPTFIALEARRALRHCLVVMADESRGIPRLLTPAEAAKALRCSSRHLSDLVHSGLLRYITLGTGGKRPRRLYREEDIVEFLNRQSRREHPPEMRPQLKALQAEMIRKRKAAAEERAARRRARRRVD